MRLFQCVKEIVKKCVGSIWGGISFIIKTGTLESKVSAIHNCSGTNRHKQALVLCACLLRAVECSALVWTLMFKFLTGKAKRQSSHRTA